MKWVVTERVHCVCLNLDTPHWNTSIFPLPFVEGQEVFSNFHDVHQRNVRITPNSVNAEIFEDFIDKSLLKHIISFNGRNPNSVVILDNASIQFINELLLLLFCLLDLLNQFHQI